MWLCGVWQLFKNDLFHTLFIHEFYSESSFYFQETFNEIKNRNSIPIFFSNFVLIIIIPMIADKYEEEGKISFVLVGKRFIKFSVFSFITSLCEIEYDLRLIYSLSVLWLYKKSFCHWIKFYKTTYKSRTKGNLFIPIWW